jgi:hypothetical protein
MGECCCAKCCGDEFDDHQGVKVAADIEGELERLQVALQATEMASYLVSALATERSWAEEAAGKDAATRGVRWLDHSKRLAHLKQAAFELKHASLELSRAMAASTTKTDEIPF